MKLFKWALAIAIAMLLAESASAALLSIAQYPLFLTHRTLPNILVIYDNSESMDGTMAGKLIAGDDPTTRGNIARGVIRNTISSFSGQFNWGLESFATYGAGLYSTYPYWLGNDQTMVFTDDCVSGVSASKGGLRCILNPQWNGSSVGDHFLTYDRASDDPDINDVLYIGYFGTGAWATTAGGGNYNFFFTHNPGTAFDRSGHTNPVPRVVGTIRRRHAVEVGDLEFLKRHTDRPVKITVPGPFTMSQQAQVDFYGGSCELAANDYAAAVNAEINDLFAAGADIVQVDEPYMQARPDEARAYGLKALNHALAGVKGTTVVHICFGYAAIIHGRPAGYSFLPELKQCTCSVISLETAQSKLDCAVLQRLAGKKIMLGVIDLADMNVESAHEVAARIRRALPYVAAEKIIVAPDCGMKYLPRDVAFGKMRAMVEGARLMRAELQNKKD